MKIAGISRVRNEEYIIQDTLKHVSELVNEIYIFDDCSTDRTPQICNAHPKVKKVLRGKTWATTPQGRQIAEGKLRQIPYEEAIKNGADWVYCFDADEFADFDDIDFSADAYRLRLFDFYITPEDIHDPYYKRKWMGPEYRDILMLFRVKPGIIFHDREPTGITGRIETRGWVKHYGKAISVEEWEKTCDYYIHYRGANFIPMFTNKWKKRKGNAIHTKSDFGRALITWEDRHNKGVPL